MLRRLGMLLAVPIAALAFAGCGFVTGGGWLPGAAGDDTKATFGFVFNADNDGLMRGTYHDPAAGVKVKFVGEGMQFGNWIKIDWVEQGKPMCTDDDTAVPCTGWGLLKAEDNGEPGTLDDADNLTIKLFEGFHMFYYNHGDIGGGNIQFHPFDFD